MRLIIHLGLVSCLLLGVAAQAHVPYFERRDFTESRPLVIPKEVEQSIAVYAWLRWGQDGVSTDVDPYRFELIGPTSIYAELLVPVCEAYRDYAPWLALVGPGLPPPPTGLVLPFEVPLGEGVLIAADPYQPGDLRETFFEPFGNKSYYIGPELTEMLVQPGVYRLQVWDPEGIGGDYVAVIGDQEIWERDDILRGLLLTPAIRQGRELHVDCPQ